ncbi:MAG TPA: hypothetical protein VLJ57_10800 [Burkholderiaceae bacterium]|nr:hypothetical protein [Burkholderiaceae bacterium]
MDINETQPAGATRREDVEAEAARYALLRRLAPVLRHQMVLHLQPLEMIVELARRRLASEQVDLASIRDGIDKIGLFSRAAMAACISSVSWLSDEDEIAIAVGEGVGECIAVLKSGLSFRGFTIHGAIEGETAKVSRRTLRSLLATAALGLSDALPAPFDFSVSIEVGASEAVIQVKALPSLGTGSFFNEKPSRILDWGDLQALARAEGAHVACHDRLVEISLPLMEQS